MEKAKKRTTAPELLFVFYYFSFSLLKPIVTKYSTYSTIILLTITIIVVVSYLFKSKMRLNRGNIYRFFLLFLFVSALFLLDRLFRPNIIIGSYYYSFIIYALVPLFLLINVNDYAKLLYYWSILSVCTGVLFLADPFFNYRWSGDYMSFGFEAILPAFAGSVLLLMYYKKKGAALFIIVFFLEIFICANKGAILTAFALFIVGYCIFSSKGNILWIRLTVMVFAGAFVYTLRTEIISMLIGLADSLKLNSYSLRSFSIMIENKDIFGLRLDLWEYAWQLFCKKPILGYGIGYLEVTTNNYAHNFFLDIMVSSGAVVCLGIIMILIYSIVFILRRFSEEKRIFAILMLVIWLVPMTISLTLWEVMPFWVYWGIISYSDGLLGEKVSIKNVYR